MSCLKSQIVSFSCESYGRLDECLGILGCQWCIFESDGQTLLATPFCAPVDQCFSGTKGRRIRGKRQLICKWILSSRTFKWKKFHWFQEFGWRCLNKIFRFFGKWVAGIASVVGRCSSWSRRRWYHERFSDHGKFYYESSEEILLEDECSPLFSFVENECILGIYFQVNVTLARKFICVTNQKNDEDVLFFRWWLYIATEVK